MELKELYLGKCLEDLEQHYVLDDAACKGKKVKMLLNTANSLFNEAEKYRREADEERSYILYMKYFGLINIIRKSPEYFKDKTFISKMLGGSARQNIAMDIVTALSNSLKNRYDNLGKISQARPLILNRDTNFNSNHLNSTKMINNSFKQNKNANSLMSYEDTFTQCNTIECEELFQMIKKQNPSASLLIMDCRSSEDFNLSKLLFPTCLNVPKEILQPGMSAGKLQLKLEESSRALWSSRAVKDQIVLLDWDCPKINNPENKEIIILKEILENYDPDVTYRSAIKILIGGYEKLIMLYPTICTNGSVVNPNKHMQIENDLLEDIEYPSIQDITMKDDALFNENHSTSLKPNQNQRKLPPAIDRSSKLAAQQTYADKQKIEILKEREALLDKALENDQSLLKVEEELKNCGEKLNDLNEDEKENYQKKYQDLLYKVMQLENKERDYKTENKRISKELEEAQKRKQDKADENEIENLLLEKRIEEKIKQQKIIDEQLQKEKQSRERQSEIKRHLKPTYEDGISKPKIPQFDRSVKPTARDYLQISRDFSPVRGSLGRGLTGLKNLGNTCYMNSIMQCLSNTGILTDYFITNNYKKHVNYENKTGGKIVEEVAALLKVLWNGQYKCIASKDLRYTIGQYQRIFSGIEQQDSHEFLTILMDWLHSDLQTIKIIESPRRDQLHASEKSWLDFTKSCESYILQLFYGQIKSTVKCRSCGKESATYESFSNLSLELPATANRCELNMCLEMYFSGESICGYSCPECKQKRDAIKKLSVSKLPTILVIHLKRFYADPNSSLNTYRKKQTYVNFPLVNLDMSPHIAQSEKRLSTSKTYDLYSISNHYGSMESGHYTAFCKSAFFKKWYKYDDSIVSSLDSSDVISSAAYILFFTNIKLMTPSNI